MQVEVAGADYGIPESLQTCRICDDKPLHPKHFGPAPEANCVAIYGIAHYQTCVVISASIPFLQALKVSETHL